MGKKSFEQMPSLSQELPLPELDEAEVARLEAKFSKDIEEFEVGELPDEAMRLFTEARINDREEDWKALWWFFRRSFIEFAEELDSHHTVELPGEREHMLSIYQHIDDPTVKADVERWYKSNPRPDQPEWDDVNWPRVA